MALRDDMLFNCCTDHAEPEWSRFAGLTISGVRDLRADLPGDETECVACDNAEAQFWTVYGRTHESDVEALTDAPTKGRALVLAGFHMGLARIVGIRLELADAPEAGEVAIPRETLQWLVRAADAIVEEWTSSVRDGADDLQGDLDKVNEAVEAAEALLSAGGDR